MRNHHSTSLWQLLGQGFLAFLESPETCDNTWCSYLLNQSSGCSGVPGEEIKHNTQGPTHNPPAGESKPRLNHLRTLSHFLGRLSAPTLLQASSLAGANVVVSTQTTKTTSFLPQLALFLTSLAWRGGTEHRETHRASFLLLVYETRTGGPGRHSAYSGPAPFIPHTHPLCRVGTVRVLREHLLNTYLPVSIPLSSLTCFFCCCFNFATQTALL